MLLFLGASEASEQSERAKLSGAFSGFPLLTHAFVGAPLLSQPFLAFAGLCWLLLGFNACYYCWGRAKLSDAFSGFPLLTHAFVGAPLLSLAFCCFASLHVVWHFLLNGTLAFPHSCSILFLVAPCLVLFSLVLPCANIS